MGEVYLAEDTNIHRQAALKVVAPELMRDEMVRKRFKEEARVMAKLKHPNIVALYAFFEEGGRFFLAMEYVDGPTLEHLLEERTMEISEAVEIAAAVLDALQYAHSRPQPVVHRDIKPSNIMLGKDGQVVVMDFGIAKALGREKLTRTRGIVGTYEYMSPEQIQGEEVSSSADIYAFGVTFYKMLTGVVPFPQKSESGIECMNAHLKIPPPPLEEYREGVPSWLQTVPAQAMAKEPGQRFPSAAAMAAALRDADDAEERREVVSCYMPPIPNKDTPDHKAKLSLRPLAWNRKVLLACGALALLAVVVLGAFFIDGKGTDKKPAQFGTEAKKQWAAPGVRAGAKGGPFAAAEPGFEVPYGINGCPSNGPADVRVTVIEFADFECPYTAKVRLTLDKLIEMFGNNIKVVVCMTPLGFHKQSLPAAHAALAAHLQGMYWEYAEQLFVNQERLGDSDLEEYAKRAGLDVSQWHRDMESEVVANQVQHQIVLAKALGISGTPGFLINGEEFMGAQPLDSFTEIISRKLQVARQVEGQGNSVADLHEKLTAEVLAGDYKRYVIDGVKPPPEE